MSSAATGRPSRRISSHCRRTRFGWACELDALCVAEAMGARVPVPEPERRIVECPGDDVVPAFRCGPVRELAQELAESATREEVRLQERDRETEREQHPHADEQPRERVVRTALHSKDEDGEVDDEQRRDEEQRRRCYRHERPPLRSRRLAEAPDPDGCNPGDNRQPDVGHDFRDRAQELRVRADLERVVRAGPAREKRPFAGERGGGEERRAEEQRQDERQSGEQVVVGRRAEPAGGEGEAEIQAHRNRRGGTQDTQRVEESEIRALPRDRPGDESERDEQRAEPAGRPPAQPHQPDEDRRHDQIGRVEGGGTRIREEIASSRQQQRRRSNGWQGQHGRSVEVGRKPGKHAHPPPLVGGLDRTREGDGLLIRAHALSLAVRR